MRPIPQSRRRRAALTRAPAQAVAAKRQPAENEPERKQPVVPQRSPKVGRRCELRNARGQESKKPKEDPNTEQRQFHRPAGPSCRSSLPLFKRRQCTCCAYRCQVDSTLVIRSNTDIRLEPRTHLDFLEDSSVQEAHDPVAAARHNGIVRANDHGHPALLDATRAASSTISELVSESRLPVGSSASSRIGIVHKRARNRDPLILARPRAPRAASHSAVPQGRPTPGARAHEHPCRSRACMAELAPARCRAPSAPAAGGSVGRRSRSAGFS